MGCTVRLYARARRVIESSRITTSRPFSTMRLARSSTASATRQWFSGFSSNVENTTSPWVDCCISVTSSGRSSMSNMISLHSGLLMDMLLAMLLSSVVLPALGGDTIMPRCPLPMGLTRSIRRIASSSGASLRARVNRSSGKIGVSESNCLRVAACSGGTPLILVIWIIARYRSPSRSGRVRPLT